LTATMHSVKQHNESHHEYDGQERTLRHGQPRQLHFGPD
jgi:hypothetical protein